MDPGVAVEDDHRLVVVVIQDEHGHCAACELRAQGDDPPVEFEVACGLDHTDNDVGFDREPARGRPVWTEPGQAPLGRGVEQ